MSDNDELVVQNAKDIQRLDDILTVQAQINKSNNQNMTWMGFVLGCLISAAYIIGKDVNKLKKRMEAIEGRYTDEA